jgi:hypothetical protein
MPYITYYCAVCGEPNETFVDESAGLVQEYAEDCRVCCRPNVLRIVINEETKEVTIAAEFEG